MERMLRAQAVAEILDYKDLDAVRRIMRNMVHMENPLRVSESALQGWIAQRTFRPASAAKPEQAQEGGRIPRRRNGKLVV